MLSMIFGAKSLAEAVSGHQDTPADLERFHYFIRNPTRSPSRARPLTQTVQPVLMQRGWGGVRP